MSEKRYFLDYLVVLTRQNDDKVFARLHEEIVDQIFQTLVADENMQIRLHDNFRVLKVEEFFFFELREEFTSVE